MTEKYPTPPPWHWDQYGQLVDKDDYLVISAGLNRNGSAYVSSNKDDQAVIAAAPELLSALESLTDSILNDRGTHARTIAEYFGLAAIKKAHGE